MEKKTYRIIKNMLFPVKTTIELGPEGITHKGKFVAWENITDFSYSITSINRAMNYIIGYTDSNGGEHYLNYMVTIAGSKKKKAMFAEIYQTFHEAMTKYHIMPKAKESAEAVRRGMDVVFAGATLNKQGITVPKPMRKNSFVHIPYEDILITHRDGSGGFDVQSSKNKKDRGYFQYALRETRYLLATLEQLFPDQAYVYK